MKRSLPWLNSWKLATMTPAPAPLTTVGPQKMLSTIFNIIALTSLTAMPLCMFQGFFKRATSQADYSPELEQAHQVISESQTELVETHHQLATARTELVETHNQLTEAQTNLAEAQRQLAAVRAEPETLRAELAEAQNQLETVRTELAQAHTVIQKQALTDGLTGLPNHRAVIVQLSKDLERTRRYEHSFSLLFFNADRFKLVNDIHGYAIGDVVLRQICERAGSVLRGGDTLGHFGGEEFVVLLPETDLDGAKIVAERIRVAVASWPMASSKVAGGIAMTVSIGLANYPTDGVAEQDLLSQADEAMYVAKQLGRNQVRTADEARKARADLELMAILQQEEQLDAAEQDGITPEQLRETYTLRMIYSLLSLLERRDEKLHEHAHAVSALAQSLAQEMGLEETQVSRITMAALLHDIGKVAIPDRLLQKNGPLSPEERTLMQEHAELGTQILEASPFLCDLMPAVRHHHERWDGSGYPDQLAGEDIPLAARIIAVAEAYDFMLRGHFYQPSSSSGQALLELQRCAGSQFDPAIVQSLSQVLTRQQDQQGPAGPAGSAGLQSQQRSSQISEM